MIGTNFDIMRRGRSQSINVGDVFDTNYGGRVVVVKYVHCKMITVRFEDGAESVCSMGQLKRGNVKNYNVPSVFGVGYCGYGNYDPMEHSYYYSIWQNTLRSCYQSDTRKVYTVDPNWHSFQNFCKDVETLPKQPMYIFTNAFVKRNCSHFSVETCAFVPLEFRSLFNGRKCTHSEHRRGVYATPSKRRYMAKCNIAGSQKYVGVQATREEAFTLYKAAKEQELKRIARKYQETLDPRVFKFLITYDVTD